MKTTHATEFTGTVVSTKMKNTIIVEVVGYKTHPLYRKTMKHSTRFAVHVPEDGLVAVGDTVKISETKPYSKTKYFVFVTKVKK